MDQFGRNETPGRDAQLINDGYRDASRTFEVIAFTGQPISTVSAGRWSRGALWRSVAPAMNLPPNVPQYDPAQGQPASWTRATS